MLCENNYLNKTIVEVESEKGGAHALLLCDGGLNLRFHCLEHLRTFLVVIITAQLS